MSRWRELNIGSYTERGNLDFHVKENAQVETPRGRIPKGNHRGGRTRSSDEVLVMGMERRGSIIPLEY